MNFETFFNQIEKSNLLLEIDHKPMVDYQLSNEALFQLPLIALIILTMAKDHRKPFVAEIGQLVGECIENSLLGFKGSSQHLGWSANLRMRTVKALGFLELSALVCVDRSSRITATEIGKKVVSRVFDKEDDLSLNLSNIKRSYRNICVAKQLKLELE